MSDTIDFASAISELLERRDLPGSAMRGLMGRLMSGQLTSAQTAALLVLLKAKGESSEELAAAAEVMREHAIKISVDAEDAVDTCGTGGDKRHTFNISTAAAIVAAGAGAKVVKHGNRSASGKSGSADVLEALGVKLDVPVNREADILKTAGLVFCFARSHHPAMKHAAEVRKELGIPTMFNLLGPMTNPAGAKRQVLGVYGPHLCDLLAGALRKLGSVRAWVVHGRDGLDELSTMAESTVAELRDGQLRRFDVDATKLGMPRAKLEDLQANSPTESATIIRGILDGKKSPARDIVVLNAGAALVVGGVAQNLEEGVGKAAAAIDQGKAKAALEALVRETN